MKKILICIDSLRGGGAEKVLIDLLNKIASKYEITLFLIFNDGLHKENLPANIKVKYLVNSRNALLQKNKKVAAILEKAISIMFKNVPPNILYRIFVRNSYEVEIAFLEGKSTKLISGSNQLSKKIAWVHTNLKNHHWTKALYKNLDEEKQQYRSFNEIVFVSHDSLEGYLEKFREENNRKLKVIYNPIDELDIKDKLKMSEESYNEFTICSIGRLGKEKGFDRLLRAHAKLISQGLYHNLIILGDGVEKDNLIKLREELKVTKTVKFLGFKKNPYKYIKNANLFVCSSRTEGYSLVLAEAMIIGLPVLSTACGGTKEILENGKYGMVVENSERGIYQGIQYLMHNREKIEYYKSMSEKRSRDFRIDKSIKQITELL